MSETINDRQTWPCPVCSATLPLKSDKKGKPYIVCEHCGLQMFVRYQEGIELMKRKGANDGNKAKHQGEGEKPAKRAARVPLF